MCSQGLVMSPYLFRLMYIHMHVSHRISLSMDMSGSLFISSFISLLIIHSFLLLLLQFSVCRWKKLRYSAGWKGEKWTFAAFSSFSLFCQSIYGTVFYYFNIHLFDTLTCACEFEERHRVFLEKREGGNWEVVM